MPDPIPSHGPAPDFALRASSGKKAGHYVPNGPPEGGHYEGRAPIRHAAYVIAAFTVLFGWLYLRPILEHAYLAESDLYEYFLPIFLSKFTIWSIFEFGGTPAFADPGEYRLYPLFLLARVLGSWTFFIASAYILAATATYAYVYSLTRSRLAATFAAVAYSLSEALMERIAHAGVLHTMAWLPLICLAIDRLRGDRPWRWMAIGALTVGSCFLAGNPQTFLYTGYVCGAYALAGGLAERAPMRYYAAATGMALIGALLTSVKTMPLLEASLYTARQVVNFAQFVSHGNTPAQMLSILFPAIVHEGREAPTYVGLATLMFALISLRHLLTSWRVAFWVAIALLALLVGAGDATPIAGAIFHLPFYDKFRVGARHLIFAAFGLATLAGYGVATVQRRQVSPISILAAVALTLVALTAAAAVITLWPGRFTVDLRYGLRLPLAQWNGTLWTQLMVGVASAAAVLGFAWRPSSRVSTLTLVTMLAIDLMAALPYSVGPKGLDSPSIAVEAAQPDVHATRLAARTAPLHQRILAPSGTQVDAVVPAMFARVWEIPIAGGYGPMLLARYGRLMMMGTNGSVDPLVLTDQNVALDVAAVKYVVLARSDLAPDSTIERNGITWTSAPLALPVGPPECGQTHLRTATYALPQDMSTSAIALVMHLRCAESVPQGDVVATLRVTGGGEAYEQPLRAGIDVAEEGLKDPALQRRAKHRPATIFEPDAPRYTYYSRIDLPKPMHGAVLEFRLTGTGGSLEIDRLTAIEEGGRNVPQGTPAILLANPDRWRLEDQFATSRGTDRGKDEGIEGEQQYVVLENQRALPLAWFAREVLEVSERELDTAVHYSLLPDGRRFEPRNMALVEAGALPPASYAAGESVVAVRSVRDSAIRVGVSTATPGFLVLSETWYPGWRARIDGTVVPMYRTDGAMQGIVVPAGQHTVDFEFESTTLRIGAVASGVTLLLVALVFWLTRRRGRDVSPASA